MQGEAGAQNTSQAGKRDEQVSKSFETVRKSSERKGKWDLKQNVIDGYDFGQLEGVETVIPGGITEWTEEER